MHAPIGLDLGTGFSVISVFRNGKAEIIPNSLGERTTPSVVAFTDQDQIIVGTAALNQRARNAENTVSLVKRVIGRPFNCPHLRADMQTLNMPCVVEGANGHAAIQVEYKGQKKLYTPEQISAFLIARMCQDAAAFLGIEKLEQIVVTVPAHFNDSQRQATINAVEIAGVKCLRVINEPTAAALAYGMGGGDRAGTGHVLVFDAGSGTHDVSLLNFECPEVAQVIATGGNTRLGGTDINERITAHCCEKLGMKRDELSPRAYARLDRAVELAKRQLSSTTTTTIEVDDDRAIELSRAKLEHLCSDLFEQTLDPVRDVLEEAEVTEDEKNKINVVMVGGTTRIPRIQRMVQQMFGGKPLHASLSPDEAVAAGAAIAANNITNGTSSGSILLLDVVPLGLGVQVEGGYVENIVARNTTIPCKKTKQFTTATDGQLVVNVNVMEGMRPLASECNLLGLLQLKGIVPAPRGTPKIEVTFSVDVSGVLSVSARDVNTKNTATAIIQRSGMSKTDIEKCIADAEAEAKADAELLARRESRYKLESLHNELEGRLEANGDGLAGEQRDVVAKWLEEAATCLTNDDASCSRVLKQGYEMLAGDCGRLLYGHGTEASASE